MRTHKPQAPGTTVNATQQQGTSVQVRVGEGAGQGVSHHAAATRVRLRHSTASCLLHVSAQR